MKHKSVVELINLIGHERKKRSAINFSDFPSWKLHVVKVLLTEMAAFNNVLCNLIMYKYLQL